MWWNLMFIFLQSESGSIDHVLQPELEIGNKVSHSDNQIQVN